MNIKFRAYVDDKMVYYKDSNFLIAFNGMVLNTTPIDIVVRWCGDYTVAGWGITHNESRVLMQYAGKDCKSNEAYEGDILKEWFSKYSSKPKSTSYGIIKREEDTCNLYIEWHACDGVGPILLRNISNLLVVGNIYENKDLLKGED